VSELPIPQKAPYVKVEEPGRRSWCACGESKNQPYCDGSHARSASGRRPVAVEFAEKKQVSWCGCKRSKNAPYCDGTHRTL
jgi:CDGSH-type Zn-finger protein